MTFKTIADNQQILSSLATGQADVTVTSDGQAGEQAEDKKLKSDTTQVDGGQFFLFNLRRPPFDDPRARRAVALAMDAQALTKTLFNGQVQPGRGVFRESSTLVGPAVAQQPAYDQAEAQRLFDELAAEGKPVNFTFLTQQHATSRKTAEYMQSRINQYRNARMGIEALEVGAYITKGLVNREFQAQNYGMWQADPDPAYDTLFRSTSTSNYGGYASPAVDRALDAARAATTPEARRQAYTDLVREIGKDLPVWVWQEATTSTVYRSQVTGVALVNEGQLVMDQIGLTG